MKAMRAKPTAEERSAAGKKGAATRLAGFTKEQLSAIAKARMAKIPPEQRSATRKKVWAGFSQEKRTAIGKKRTAKLTHEDHVAHGKKGFERMIAKVIATRRPARIKRGAPIDIVAPEFYAAWLKEGSPSGQEAVIKIATPFYPDEVSWSKSYPKRRRMVFDRFRKRLADQKQRKIYP